MRTHLERSFISSFWRVAPGQTAARCARPRGAVFCWRFGVVLLTAALGGTLAGAGWADDAASSQTTLEVEPTQLQLASLLDRGQLVVRQVARGPAATGGQSTDLTRQASFRSSDASVVEITETGLAIPRGPGKARIEVLWQDQRAGVEVEVAAEGSVGFVRDVMPVLNRTGCTSGACHASQYGKGGLKLSLLGFAPEQDYPALVRDELQRRISLVAPGDSLLLQKPLMKVAHGGGRRFVAGDYNDQVLRAWLKAGAPPPVKEAPRVVDLRITPQEAEYSIDQTRQLRVLAVYSDGSQRDVTTGAMYDSLNESVAAVDESGFVRATGPGQGPIMIRYLGQAKTSLAVVPYRTDAPQLAFDSANFVDRLVAGHWRKLGLQPAGRCSDTTFIRRAFLDAVGTLPAPERVAAFLQSDAPDKRTRLVDELLGLTGDPERDQYVDQWSAYWSLKWADLIRNNRNKLGDGGMWALHNWIRSSLRENKPVDQFVRELITAQGSVFQSGPANYYKITSKPDELAEATAQIFLGVRLQCAKCHHHPFEVYSQRDYYGLAAFFTRVGTKASQDFGALGGDTVVLVKQAGSIRHPRTGETMQPTPLLGEPLAADSVRDLRRPLAQWLTSGDNPLFARNIANRFWGYFMGTGLVEPIDDMRATNPPSNPELLDALADHLVQNQFDLRQLMRVIMLSNVYQLDSAAVPGNPQESRFYTHYNVKRVPAEVLLDAIDALCGTQEKFSGIPAGTRAIELPDPNYASYFLDTTGRPQRVITCECERTTEPNLAQVLHLLNGDTVLNKVGAKDGRVAHLAVSNLSDEAIVSELYLRAFSRQPTEDELAYCVAKVIQKAENRREGIEDLLWALLNTREFLLNH